MTEKFSKPFTDMATTTDRNEEEVSGAFVISFVVPDKNEVRTLSGMLTNMKEPSALLALVQGQIQVALNELQTSNQPGFPGPRR